MKKQIAAKTNKHKTHVVAYIESLVQDWVVRLHNKMKQLSAASN
ncbi:MAG: hypothetical protein ACJATI_000724, partial [Halioglobus sp.]